MARSKTAIACENAQRADREIKEILPCSSIEHHELLPDGYFQQES